MGAWLMAAYQCPCCGAPIGEAAPIEDVIASLSGQVRIIATLLAKRIGYPVDLDAVVAALYGRRPDGGPELALKIANSRIVKLRMRLAAHGWTVTYARRAGRGNSGNYKLIPIDSEAA
jgi:hypothetical protein